MPTRKMPAKKEKRFVPRYENFRPRNTAASRVGASNRRQDTTPEIILREALRVAGIQYRLRSAALPGQPDLVIARHRIAVFCDGDFWHGRRWHARKMKLMAGWNASYWVAKIERNRQRDREVNRALLQLGWTVVRVWEGDVRRNPARAAAKILKVITRVS